MRASRMGGRAITVVESLQWRTISWPVRTSRPDSRWCVARARERPGSSIGCRTRVTDGEGFSASREMPALSFAPASYERAAEAAPAPTDRAHDGGGCWWARLREAKQELAAYERAET